MIELRMTSVMRAAILQDLLRPHRHAAERVGFLACKPGATATGCIVLAHSYYPVADDHYLESWEAATVIGASAFRVALQLALDLDASVMHVHLHEMRGRPAFSLIDLRESRRFVPDFFNVVPNKPHGAIVFSHDSAAGLVWQSKRTPPRQIQRFSVVGEALNGR